MWLLKLLTYWACSSGPLQLGGGLQAAVLLPVVPAGGAQSTLHVGWPPSVPLLRLGRCGEPQENTQVIFWTESRDKRGFTRLHTHTHKKRTLWVSTPYVANTAYLLTVAALTAESLLEACSPVHTRFAARNHDLVGVGFGAAGETQQVSSSLKPENISDGLNVGLLTRWGCTPAWAYCLLLLPSVVSAGEKRNKNTWTHELHDQKKQQKTIWISNDNKKTPAECSGPLSSTCSKTGPRWLKTSMAAEWEEKRRMGPIH